MDTLEIFPPTQQTHPSVFELIAEQKLDALLVPALRYVATVIWSFCLFPSIFCLGGVKYIENE